MARLINLTQKQTLAGSVLKARSLWSRMKGLLGRDSLGPSETMWIAPCSSIHTYFMRFPIDVIFVDRKLRVKAYYFNVPPGKTIWPRWGYHSVFEFQAGALIEAHIQKGDQLHVED